MQPLRRGARAHPHAGAHARPRTRPTTTCARSRPRSRRPRAAGRTTSRSRSSRRWARSAPTGAVRAYGTAFPVGLSRRRDAARRRARHRGHGALDADATFAVSLYRPVEGDERHAAAARLPRSARSVPLSASLPVLENMGLEVLDEVSLRDRARAGAERRVHARLRHAQRAAPIPDVEAIKAITEEALLARRARARSRTTASTASRRGAALAADDVMVLRAYAKYLKQAGFTFSQAYIEQTLAAHAASPRSWWRSSTRASTRRATPTARRCSSSSRPRSRRR